MEYARQAMEVLNQYLSGDIWGFVVEKRNHCDTCQHDEWEQLDSCWGFYGHESAEAEGNSMLEHHTAAKAA